MAKILIVDDDRDMRDNLAAVLDQAGFAFVCAENGEAALSRLEQDSFDLVLLDSIMPGLKGIDILPLIKRGPAQTRVIMLTAFSSVDGAVEAMRKGADDYLTKPFKINDLLVAVRRCLEEARFSCCEELLKQDETFKCLANQTRRRILRLLQENTLLRFMDITRHLGITDHTKVNFHLRSLRETGLLEQDGRKCYRLSPRGKKIIACMQSMAPD